MSMFFGWAANVPRLTKRSVLGFKQPTFSGEQKAHSWALHRYQLKDHGRHTIGPTGAWTVGAEAKQIPLYLSMFAN